MAVIASRSLRDLSEIYGRVAPAPVEVVLDSGICYDCKQEGHFNPVITYTAGQGGFIRIKETANGKKVERNYPLCYKHAVKRGLLSE